jgi:hypothetical protein
MNRKDLVESCFDDLWQEMLADGTVVATSELRPNSKGELEPVYMFTGKGNHAMTAAGKALAEAEEG